MGALHTAVVSGRALYAGISSYSAQRTREAATILADLGTPLLIHQPSYSMFNRWIEPGLVDTATELGIGIIAFSPLAQGLLTSRYLNGVPAGSRGAKGGSMRPEFLSEETLHHVRELDLIASSRSQTLAQLALAWALRQPVVSSVLIGASSVAQLEENLTATRGLGFTDEELRRIDEHALDLGINLWQTSSAS
jgi:L-glyceraldehyde 3-phosphate reductase